MSELMTVGVAGAGLMGSGIAATLAKAGHFVLVYDKDPAARERLASRCARVFREAIDGQVLAEAEASEASERIRTVDGVEDLASLHLVIEAVIESLPVKRTLYGELEACLLPSAIIASSTSAYMPTDLAEQLKHPGRFAVTHFWNPPHLIPLVEVLATPATDKWVVDAVMSFLRSVGCEPVFIKKAIPGFIGNRMQFAVLREALHLLRERVADAETIDFVMKHSLGRRYSVIGPLEGVDLGGLDTFLTIATHLMPKLAKDEDVLELLRARTECKQRGRSTGQGFYTWDDAREAWLKNARLEMLRMQGERVKL